MEFRVVERDELDTAAWEKLAVGGSFFQTVAWADIGVGALPHHPRSVFLCGYDGSRLMAGMPAVITRRFGLKAFYSMPDGTYGGPVIGPDCPDKMRSAFLNTLAGYLRQHDFSRIAIADFGGTLKDWHGHGLQRTQSFTHIVRLDRPENFQPHKKIEYDIRAGQKVDSEIIMIDKLSLVDDFYRLYLLTKKRHEGGGPLREGKFFEIIFRHLEKTGKLYWTGLMAEGEMVGSQIHFIHGETLFNWQTVSDYDKRQFKPSQLLMNDAIAQAAALNLKTVNLGASPPDAEGLIRYKERWQGIRVEYDILTSRSLLRRLVGR